MVKLAKGRGASGARSRVRVTIPCPFDMVGIALVGDMVCWHCYSSVAAAVWAVYGCMLVYVMVIEG